MARLSRVFQRIFGSGAGTDQIAQFGSLFAGSPAFTTDPSTAQSLSNWLTGWFGAAIGGNAPAIEDMNAPFFVSTYQLAYLMQAGVAEWDTSTVYYIGSLVQDGTGVIYKSLTDSNTGNALTSAANWQRYSSVGAVQTKSANYTVTPNDGVILANAGSGGFNLSLPPATAAPGQPLYIKKVDSTGNAVSILPNGSDAIDGATSISLRNQNDAIILIPDGVATWRIVGEFTSEFVSNSLTTPTTFGATNTPVNIASITLTPGTWEINAIAEFSLNSGTNTYCQMGISANSASFTGTLFGDTALQIVPPQTVADMGGAIPQVRITVAANTPYYLVGQAGFTIAATSYRGRISATKVKLG